MNQCNWLVKNTYFEKKSLKVQHFVAQKTPIFVIDLKSGKYE